MKKQALGMIAALFAFMVMLPAWAYAADAAPDVYAILYEDGTLVFQNGAASDGRTVKETYEVDLSATYLSADSVPWYNERESILVASFADKVSPVSTTHWFYKCQNLERVDNISKLDTSNVTDMSYMFYLCSGLTELDLSSFDTANVIGMIAMFYDCTGLTALDVSNFNTSNVMYMERMFFGCRKLTALDLSSFHLAESVNVNGMFSGCSGLTELDLSSFDAQKVWRMSGLNGLSGMFANCTSLKTIFTSGEFPFGLRSSDTFRNCASLVGGNGTKYDEAFINGGYARIDTPSAPGYFTYKPYAPDECVIAYAVAGNGKLSVVFSNPADATLAVSYFDETGKFLSAQLQDAQANAGMTVALELPEGASKARAMLLDSALCPLCGAYAADVGGAA